VLDLSPPEAVPVTTLDLVPGVLFPGDITPGRGTGRHRAAPNTGARHVEERTQESWRRCRR
jgi:hypothetical protein